MKCSSSKTNAGITNVQYLVIFALETLNIECFQYFLFDVTNSPYTKLKKNAHIISGVRTCAIEVSYLMPLANPLSYQSHGSFDCLYCYNRCEEDSEILTSANIVTSKISFSYCQF